MAPQRCRGQYNFQQHAPTLENFPSAVNLNRSLGIAATPWNLFSAYMDEHKKMGIPDFDGKLNARLFLDWLFQVENILLQGVYCMWCRASFELVGYKLSYPFESWFPKGSRLAYYETRDGG